jgi:Ca2+-binding EF-hand superfamily protein
LPGWFGAEGTKSLSLKEFEGFLADLHNSIREIYFDTLDSNGDGYIDGREFAMSLTNFASNKDLPRFAKRIAKLSEEDVNVKVDLKDFISWKYIFDNIDEIDSAITLFVAGVGEEFSAQQLKRAAKSVTNIVLNDEQLKVLLSVFDEDGNGTLSRSEFADVFKKASSFGLAKPRDFGLVRFVSCCSDCIKKD